jgi:hypothetical protein
LDEKGDLVVDMDVYWVVEEFDRFRRKHGVF